MKPQAEVTQILLDLRRGNRERFNELLPLVYDELHELARRQRSRWQGDYTVNTTALVHEAYLKLVGQSTVDFESRAHFLAVAARAMRQILIDYAKQRQAQKRGGDVQKVTLDEGVHDLFGGELLLAGQSAETLLALDEALARLAQIDERLGLIVECRFFGEMTIEETAAVLGVSPATVKRSWTTARAWLYHALKDPS